jgi:hypothetical protein
MPGEGYVVMGDIMSILQSSYASASLNTPSSTPYTNVDPALYQGKRHLSE